MRIDIAGISIDSILLIIIIGIMAGTIITKLLLDTIIKNIFATYPDDTKESLRFIIDYINCSIVRIVLLGELEGKPSPTVDYIKSTVDVPILMIKNLYRA